MPLALVKLSVNTVICYLFATDFISNFGSLTLAVAFKSQNPQFGSYFRNLNLRKKTNKKPTKPKNPQETTRSS